MRSAAVAEGRPTPFAEPTPASAPSKAATRTTCAYCGVGCGVVATPTDEGFAISGDAAHPAGAGRLCSKGSALGDTLTARGRLLVPRVDGRETGWDEALGHVAARIAATIAEHGPESFAMYVSGQLLTEDYYVANKFVKGFVGTANIDTNSRLCMSSTVAAQQRVFGEDVVPGCYEDLELADLVVLVGSNTAWCHPVLFRRIEEARKRRPSMRLVVVDPRRTPTAEAADLHLPIAAGTDVVLFDGLLAWLDREGLADRAFVAAHTSGARDAVDVARRAAPDAAAVATACSIDEALVAEFFRLFGASERVVTAFSQGVNQSSSGTDKATAILNVHLLTGRIGKPGAGPFSLTGQPNAMGGREVGGMAGTLAAHFQLEDPVHRRVVREFWKSPRIATHAGLKAVDMFEAVRDGRVKALWIVATNPAVSLPNADRVREAIRDCDFVVVSDCTDGTDTTQLADVLLPAAAWGEKDGTVTNSERCISRQRCFAEPAGLARPDWWIVSEVASRMGFADAFRYGGPHEVFDEHARLTALRQGGRRVFDIGGLAGLARDDYDALEPIRWPVPVPRHRGTDRLFGDGRFAHGDGRARMVPTYPRDPAHARCRDFPFALNTGRIRDQWHTMTRTGLSARLSAHLDEPYLEIATGDAAEAGIGDGGLARVRTKWGSAVLRARVSDNVGRGTLFAPIHWSAANSSGGRIGAVVNPAADPVSGEPEFKHTPAAVEPVPLAWRASLFAREAVVPEGADWWVAVRENTATRVELAGATRLVDLVAWGRLALGAGDDGDLVEYVDAAAGVYRGAVLADSRLERCVFVGLVGEKAPTGGEWIDGLFAKEVLDDDDRTALAAGRATSGERDTSPLVCSCFGVRRAAIESAIAAKGLDSTAAIGSCLRAGTNCGSCLPELRVLLPR